MIVFDGKAFACRWNEQIAHQLEYVDHKPNLVLVMVGRDGASEVYVKLKKRLAQKLGIKCRIVRLSQKESRTKVEAVLAKLNTDIMVDGIVVQLPLPGKLRDVQSDIVSVIDRDKDVDGLRDNARVWPAVVRAVGEVVGSQRLVDRSVRKMMVVGSGFVAQKIEEFFVNNYSLNVNWKLEVKRIAGRDPRLAEHTREADVIISCVGRAKVITGEMVKKGVVIFDLGTMPVEKTTNLKRSTENFRKDVGIVSLPTTNYQLLTTSLKGDVEFETVAPKARFITPVPGGVGPVTVSALFANLVDLAKSKGKHNLGK